MGTVRKRHFRVPHQDVHVMGLNCGTTWRTFHRVVHTRWDSSHMRMSNWQGYLLIESSCLTSERGKYRASYGDIVLAKQWESVHQCLCSLVFFLQPSLMLRTPDLDYSLEGSWPNVKAISVIEDIIVHTFDW